jgi:hypothetical protein
VSSGGLDRVGVDDIRNDRQRRHTLSTNLLGSRFEPRCVASEERDVCALPGKFQGRCSANPCAGAGDDSIQNVLL